MGIARGIAVDCYIQIYHVTQLPPTMRRMFDYLIAHENGNVIGIVIEFEIRVVVCSFHTLSRQLDRSESA